MSAVIRSTEKNPVAGQNCPEFGLEYHDIWFTDIFLPDLHLCNLDLDLTSVELAPCRTLGSCMKAMPRFSFLFKAPEPRLQLDSGVG